MTRKSVLYLLAASLIWAGLSVMAGQAQTQQPAQVQIPKPGVPQIMTIEGRYVRIAYNNEGYVSLGYKLANLSVGEPWMLLEVGLTVREGVRNYTLTREMLSVDTPDGTHIPLPSVADYRKADLRPLQARLKVQRDSIDYFPPKVSQACAIQFFQDVGSPAMAYDQVELSDMRGCVGRVYFPIPGGITYGQHWLNVKFENSVVRVPFRIFTKEEDKLLDKNFKDIKKQVDEAFKKKSTS